MILDMYQRIRGLATLLCLLFVAASCAKPAAAPPAPSPTPTPAPPEEDLAWLWLPTGGDSYMAGLWRRGTAWQIPPSDLVAVTASGRLRALGHGVTDIIARPGRSPLATLPIAPTSRLALIDPASGATVGDRQIAPGGVISPDGTRFAARISVEAGGPYGGPSNALQITSIASGITTTTDLFDNSTLKYQNVLHAWGPHYIYGATHDRHIHTLWWIDPDRPGAERQSLRYGPDDVIGEVALNAQADTLVYTWQPEASAVAVVTTTLMLQNTFTGAARQVGAGEPWPQTKGMQFSDLSLSPDGRYLACLRRYADDRPAAELRLYDLSRPGPPRILDPALIPWDGWEYGERQYAGEIYAWSPDSAHLLVRTLPQPDQPGAPQRALIFRGGDGALVERVDLAADTGALSLTDDLRLIMITYQGEQASLVEYDARAHRVTRRIPLGAQAPIIVYVPE